VERNNITDGFFLEENDSVKKTATFEDLFMAPFKSDK